MNTSTQTESLHGPIPEDIPPAPIDKSVFYHVYTGYLFICNNIKDIIGLGFLFGAINALVAPKLAMGPARSISEILKAAPSMLLWSWSNLFIFNLHNQRNSIDEDAMNKPWRPLPSNRITHTQATRLMYCMYPVILTISLRVGGLGPCLLEAFSCIWYNEWNGASDPILKNILNGVGFACFFAGPLEVATGYSVCTKEALTWLGMFAGAISTMSHLQDFRDMHGDAIAGRKTLPLAIGHMYARFLVGLGVGAWTHAACAYWQVGVMALCAWVPGIALVFHLFWDSTREGDTFTWKLFPLWIVGLMVLSLSGS